MQNKNTTALELVGQPASREWWGRPVPVDIATRHPVPVDIATRRPVPRRPVPRPDEMSQGEIALLRAFHATAPARRRKPIPSRVELVLTEAGYDPSTTRAFWGCRDTLARLMGGCSRSTVDRRLRGLIAAGVIHRIGKHRRPGARFALSIYVVETIDLCASQRGEAPYVRHGVPGDVPGDAVGDAQSSFGKELLCKKAPTGRVEATPPVLVSGDAEQAVAVWKAATGDRYVPPSDGRKLAAVVAQVAVTQERLAGAIRCYLTGADDYWLDRGCPVGGFTQEPDRWLDRAEPPKQKPASAPTAAAAYQAAYRGPYRDPRSGTDNTTDTGTDRDHEVTTTDTGVELEVSTTDTGTDISIGTDNTTDTGVDHEVSTDDKLAVNAKGIAALRAILGGS